MKCSVCSCEVREAKYIAIDENGDPQVMCDECWRKIRIFFEEVKPSGKVKS